MNREEELRRKFWSVSEGKNSRRNEGKSAYGAQSVAAPDALASRNSPELSLRLYVSFLSLLRNNVVDEDFFSRSNFCLACCLLLL
jgi:hypothetical protein